MFSCFLNGVLKEFVTPILVWVYPSPYVLNPRSFTRHHACLTLLCKQQFFRPVACLLVSTCYTHNYLETPLDGQREIGRPYKSFSDFSPSQTPVGKVFGKKKRFLFNIARFSSCFSALKLVICFAKNYVFVFIK